VGERGKGRARRCLTDLLAVACWRGRS
jgi:hypothetical protein